MKKVNVMHVVQYLEIGGLESLVLALCDHVDQSKFNLNVLCLRGYDPQYKKEIEGHGAAVFLIEKKNTFDFSFIMKIIQLMKAKKIDIAHVHSGCFFYGMISAFISGVHGRIYTSHGMPIHSGIKIWFEDHIAAMMAHHLVAVSDEIRENIISRFPKQIAKTELIINGIDIDKYIPLNNDQLIKIKERLDLPVDKKIIGSVGRLEPVKNYQMLIRAFSQLLKTLPIPVHLVLIGCGTEDEKLEQLVTELSISNNVSFLGVQYDIYTILPAIDIFVLSSLSEGTSISLLEAQSCGIPAVVTDVGGNGKIIKNGRNGFLCSVNDEVEMSSRFSALLTNEELFLKMKENARALVEEHYAISSMVTAYENLYDSLCKKRVNR